MPERRNIKRKGWCITAGLLVSLCSTLATAVSFSPYPGKRQVTVDRVEAPGIVVVTFDTDAAGFTRTLGIRLPHLVFAQDTPRSDDCEREAAGKVLPFMKDFLNSAKKVYIQDMRMENSADTEAVSPLLTDKGSLSAALIKEGLARPDSVDPETPWCK